MQGTFHTPLGKVRVASHRRFVIAELGGDDRLRVIKRSDSESTLRRHRRSWGFSSGDHYVIIDTVEGTSERI